MFLASGILRHGDSDIRLTTSNENKHRTLNSLDNIRIFIVSISILQQILLGLSLMLKLRAYPGILVSDRE